MKRVHPLQQISIFILTVGLFAIFALTGCHKYEEGPTLSLRSREGRVANGWKVPYFTRNQIDVTMKYDFITFDFNKNGRFSWSQQLAGETALVLEGTWLLVDGDEYLRLTFDDKTKSWGQDMMQMEIRQLKENEMRLTYILQGNEYVARLIPR